MPFRYASRRRRTFKRSSRNPSRLYKRRTRFTRSMGTKRFARRRRIMPKQINERTIVHKNMSVDFELLMSRGASANQWYNCFIDFHPIQAMSLASNQQILLTNVKPSTLVGLNTIPDLTAIRALYSKTKLLKVIVKYTPAITIGAQNVQAANGFWAANAIMGTMPVYDNVDDFVNQIPQVIYPTDYQNALRAKSKPYFREHSIYKPWKRVINPIAYIEQDAYQTSTDIGWYKKIPTPWVDFDSPFAELYGFFIQMPVIKQAGVFSGSLLPEEIPGSNQDQFYFGRLTFTFVQAFKIRE
ncbi:MAG: putative capsid protein [Cressdnaviricota sp.]|nr:MAG: putative capsid protein [Cressdnaviricota sp.]